MTEPLPKSELFQHIQAEIAGAGGWIPFRRFMDLALYAPRLGYYEQSQKRVGSSGDFYTSVRVGPLLGELLAFHFLSSESPSETPGVLLEAGAHDGQLASDILTALSRMVPGKTFDYWLMEPSEVRRGWQARTLQGFSSQIRWVRDWEELRQVLPDGIEGMVLSNELLDAFPVHRLIWSASQRKWTAAAVRIAPAGFAWCTVSAVEAGISHDHLPPVDPELACVLPDGFLTEICPAAREWWDQAARHLHRGRLLTLDYGLLADEFLAPHRAGGTLRGYANHRPVDDLLAHPGQQDLTAHVDFSTLLHIGEAAGLATSFFGSQSRWLMQLFGKTQEITGPRFPVWGPERVRQFQTLTHPEHLGRSFQVLEQVHHKPDFARASSAGGVCAPRTHAVG